MKRKKKTYASKKFAFIYKKKKYTQAIINVNFDYSYKEFNKAGKNAFVRAGYNYKEVQAAVNKLCK